MYFYRHIWATAPWVGRPVKPHDRKVLAADRSCSAVNKTAGREMTTFCFDETRRESPHVCRSQWLTERWRQRIHIANRQFLAYHQRPKAVRPRPGGRLRPVQAYKIRLPEDSRSTDPGNVVADGWVEPPQKTHLGKAGFRELLKRHLLGVATG